MGGTDTDGKANENGGEKKEDRDALLVRVTICRDARLVRVTICRDARLVSSQRASVVEPA